MPTSSSRVAPAVPAEDKVFWQFGVPNDWKEGKEVVVELPSILTQ